MRFFKNSGIYINVHKTYRLVMTALVAALLLTQLALTSPAARSALTFTDRLEGVSGDGRASMLGEIKLTLVGAAPSSEIEVLQNGQTIAFFFDREVTLTVSDNSVIEIDGRASKEPFVVNVHTVSPNITIENSVTAAEVRSNIALIGRVFVK